MDFGFQKLPFNEEKVKEILANVTLDQTLFHNDIYYNQIVTIPSNLNGNVFQLFI